MMVNAQLFKFSPSSPLLLNRREVLETNASGDISLSHMPITPLFVYDTNHNKISYTSTGQTIHTSLPQYSEVHVDYYYSYNNGY